MRRQGVAGTIFIIENNSVLVKPVGRPENRQSRRAAHDGQTLITQG